MSEDLVTCGPDDDIDAAERTMAGAQKSRVLITDDEGRCTGVLSLSDIAQLEGGDRAGRLLNQVTRREARPTGGRR